MEFLNIPYQYIEVDPYKKPQALLEVNPRGLVPGIRHGGWGCGESTVLLEYVGYSSSRILSAYTNNFHSLKILFERITSLTHFCLTIFEHERPVDCGLIM